MAWRVFDDADLAAVAEVFQSGNLCSIHGAQTAAFEAEFAAEFRAPYALAVVNAMAGLHCAVAAAGVQPGDEVIVDSVVAFAALAVLYHNGIPVFADIDPATHQIDPRSVEARVTERTRAILCTNLWGLCADYDAIGAIARRHGLLVIEDCAHAIYATYRGTYAGCNGDVGVYSFQMSKQMALGDGGMIVCRTPELREAMAEMITFGTLPARVGWNYRLNELVAAVGRVQLRRARGYVDDCIAAANLYNEAVAGCPWIIPQEVPADRTHAYHIWAARFDGERYGIPRGAFAQALTEAGLGLQPGSYLSGRPPYLHPVIAEPIGYGRRCPVRCPHASRVDDYAPGLCPNAEELMQSLMITGTNGGPAAHRPAADKLREVIARFS